MKKIILAAVALAAIAGTASVQAAPRQHHVATAQQDTAVHSVDGQKLFDDIANRATQ